MELKDLSSNQIELYKQEGNDLVLLTDIEETLYQLLVKQAELKKELEEVERQLTCFKNKLVAPMGINRVKKIITDNHNIGITYVAPTIKKKIDLEKFEKEFPHEFAIYQSCLEETETVPYVKVSILKEKKETITYVNSDGEIVEAKKK